MFHGLFTSGVATRLRAGQFGVQIPVGARDFSLLENVQNCSGAHPASYSVVVSWGSSGWGVKLTAHLNLVSWFKKERSCTSTPVYLHGVDREKYTFFLLSV
jgi:hypothetical protein